MKEKSFRLYLSILICLFLMLSLVSAVAENNTINTSGLANGSVGATQVSSENPYTLDQIIRIGVLANRGSAISLQEWGPTAEYLTRQLYPVRFEIVPLNFNETTKAAENRDISFIIANPSVYTYLEYHGLAQRIATLQVPGDPDPQPVFGGVIFTRSNRTDIRSITDLRGKRFAAVDTSSLGGWQAALMEIINSGLVPEKDFSSLNFTGTHDGAVLAVLNGEADAGTTRSTQLERMAKEGKIDLDQITVLNNQKSNYPNYPYLLSTDLYPEWPFAAVSGTDKDLSKKVSISLLMMNEDDPAAKAARGAGWAIPQDHTTIHELLRELHLPPYENYGEPTVQDVLDHYWQIILGIIVGICVLSILLTYTWRTKNNLSLALTQIRESEGRLKQSEEKYRLLAENSTDVIWTMDLNGAFTYVSPSVFQLRGYTPEEVLHQKMEEAICPSSLPVVQQKIQESLASIKDGVEIGPGVTDVEQPCRDGSTVWTEAVTRIIFNDAGEPAGFIGVSRNISDRKISAEALTESEKQYRDLFESSHDAIMTLEPPSWKFTTCNQATVELFGVVSEEEFCSFGPGDVSPKTQPDGLDSLCKVKDMIQMALCKGSHSYEWTHTRINGKDFPATVLLTRMNRYGVEYLQATIRDITQQKESEDQIRQIVQRLTLAAEAAHFGVWDLNLTDYHLEWDDWMHHLYGINRGEFNGTYEDWQQRIHPDDLDRVRTEVDQAIRGEKPFDSEFRIIKPDGEIRYLKANATVSYDRDNIPVRTIGINYDITDRKQYEWEITQYAEQLGAQNLTLEELSDELTQLNQELDEKVRERTEEISHLLTVKNDLITQIGHDLKTPLTSLIALLPYIGRQVHDPDLIELFDVVNLDAKRMNQIITSILTLSTIDIKTPDELVGESQVAKIVDRVIAGEHLFINQGNLQVINVISPSFVIRMNEAHLDLIFSNLIGNAVKYSKVGGEITISIEPGADTFCLIVQDDGQGIASDALPRIFEEFFKADSSRHDRDSHGLGLALVQRIVKSYGGTITAESEGIGMGTTIRVIFPGRMVIRSPK